MCSYSPWSKDDNLEIAHVFYGVFFYCLLITDSWFVFLYHQEGFLESPKTISLKMEAVAQKRWA